MMVFNGRTRSESTTVLYCVLLFERKAVVRLPFYSVVDFLYIYLSVERFNMLDLRPLLPLHVRRKISNLSVLTVVMVLIMRYVCLEISALLDAYSSLLSIESCLVTRLNCLADSHRRE